MDDAQSEVEKVDSLHDETIPKPGAALVRGHGKPLNIQMTALAYRPSSVNTILNDL